MHFVYQKNHKNLFLAFFLVRVSHKVHVIKNLYPFRLFNIFSWNFMSTLETWFLDSNLSCFYYLEIMFLKFSELNPPLPNNISYNYYLLLRCISFLSQSCTLSGSFGRFIRDRSRIASAIFCIFQTPFPLVSKRYMGVIWIIFKQSYFVGSFRKACVSLLQRRIYNSVIISKPLSP